MKRISRAILGTIALGSVLALAPPAGAVSSFVSLGGAGCGANIQTALDNATTPGNVVSLGAGVCMLTSTLTVGPASAGIVIRGAGMTASVIDGTNLGASDVLDVNAVDVTVRDLTLQYPIAGGGGRLINVSQKGVRIRRVLAQHANDDCIRISARAGGVFDSVVRFCGSEGIEITSNYGWVQGNRVTDTTDECIRMTSSHAQVIHNFVGMCGGVSFPGIFIDGGDSTARDNTVRTTGSFGIRANSANGVLIVNNDVQDAGDHLISSSGENPVVIGNHARGTDDHVFDINCTSTNDCTLARVANNVATGHFGTSDADIGFLIQASGPYLVVTGNLATHVDGPGFDIVADKSDIYVNTATGNSGDGFHVQGTENEVTGNTSTGNGGNGFQIGSLSTSDTLVKKNVASGNTDAGFANASSATNTTFTGNTASGNGVPLCDDGTGTINGGGNNFSVASAPSC